MSVEVDCKGVDYYKAADGRVVAMHVKAGFADFEKFPPYLDTEEAKEHIRKAYAGQDPEVERRTKAHLTDDEWPLQMILLERPTGATTKAHYHVVERRPSVNETRHQIMICLKGAARIGVYTREGDHLGEATVRAGEFILMAEGHEVEFTEEGTRFLEVKEGPFPETDERDKVELA